MADTPATVDEYISSCPDQVQVILTEIRRRIRLALPEAGETISYGIPTFTLDGKYLLYVGGWKNHIAVYPVPAGDAAFEDEIAPYRAGKGTLRFPLRKPIPYELIERMVGLLVAQRG